MRKSLLIFSMAAMLTLSACSKQSAKEPQNQQDAQTGSAATSEAAPPAPTPAPPPAETNATPAPMPSEAAAPQPEAPKPLVVPAGTVITVRLGDTRGSGTSQTGDNFTGTTSHSISVGGKTAIPASSSVEGTVVSAQKRGRIKGEGELELALTEITILGHRYPVETTVFSSVQKGKGKRTAVTTGGGAAVGGLLGGGKGLAIGAAAGLAGGALTGNKQVELAAETAVSFKLKTPITLK
jgi:glucose/arabinose dehydrogenase